LGRRKMDFSRGERAVKKAVAPAQGIIHIRWFRLEDAEEVRLVDEALAQRRRIRKERGAEAKGKAKVRPPWAPVARLGGNSGAMFPSSSVKAPFFESGL